MNQRLADALWLLLPDVGDGDVTIPSLLARQIYQQLRTGQCDE
jgi:hypothetical protein